MELHERTANNRIDSVRREKARANYTICRCCECWGVKRHLGREVDGCLKLDKPCRTWEHIWAGKECPDDPPRWDPVQ